MQKRKWYREPVGRCQGHVFPNNLSKPEDFSALEHWEIFTSFMAALDWLQSKHAVPILAPLAHNWLSIFPEVYRNISPSHSANVLMKPAKAKRCSWRQQQMEPGPPLSSFEQAFTEACAPNSQKVMGWHAVFRLWRTQSIFLHQTQLELSKRLYRRIFWVSKRFAQHWFSTCKWPLRIRKQNQMQSWHGMDRWNESSQRKTYLAHCFFTSFAANSIPWVNKVHYETMKSCNKLKPISSSCMWSEKNVMKHIDLSSLSSEWKTASTPGSLYWMSDNNISHIT